jgi:hypothetical protein
MKLLRLGQSNRKHTGNRLTRKPKLKDKTAAAMVQLEGKTVLTIAGSSKCSSQRQKEPSASVSLT